MDKHLISVEEFKELARPVSVHIEEDDVRAFIRESEDTYIIPALGYAVCKKLAETERNELSDDEKVLLSGGEWTDCKGEVRYCNGLKKAVAYFAYARMARSDGSIIARAGFMRHGDEYSDHIESKERRDRENDVMNMAEKYLAEAMAYWNSVTGKVKPVRGTRAVIKAIGD